MLLLQISDIHFQAPQCLNPDTDPDRGIRTRIERHLAEQLSVLGKIDAILVCGDIAFKGDPREYGEAKSWLTKLAENSGCAGGPILVIPGNHDIDRAMTKTMSTRNAHRAVAEPENGWRDSALASQLGDPQTAEALLRGHSAYNDFAAPLNCQIYPGRLSWKQDLNLTDKVKLRVHGLTSTILSGRDGKDESKQSLFLGPDQLAFDPVPDVVHMTMCHHPVDWLVESDPVEDALNRRVMLQMFGHKHRQRVLQDTDFVRWGAGAVNPSRYEGSYEPGYNIVRLEIEGNGSGRHLLIETRQFIYQSNPERFKTIETSVGESVFRHKIAFPEDVVPDFGPLVAVTVPAPAQTDAEAAMGAEVDRAIIARFWELASSDRRYIATELALLEPGEMALAEPERYGKALIRAKERGLLDRLVSMISEREER